MNCAGQLIFFVTAYVLMNVIRGDLPPDWIDLEISKGEQAKLGIDIYRQVESMPDRCLKEARAGKCRAAIPSWFYNSTEYECQEFIHGGCPDDDENVFPTRDHCYRTCRPDVCLFTPETGPCRARIIQWFYDAQDHTCKQFVYGGCKGNANAFGSEERCYRTCQGTTRACMLGEKFVTVGQRATTRDFRAEDWFTYQCNNRCRQACLQDDYPWGPCFAFSTTERWYGCDCFLFDRSLSKTEMDSETDGITRNRACMLN